MNPPAPCNYPLYFIYAEQNPEHPFGYEHFWNTMIQLDSKLLKDEALLRQWGRP